MFKKSLFIIIFSAVLICFFGINVPGAKALTANEIKDLISKLQAQIAELEQQLSEIETGKTATSTAPVSEAWCYDFTKNLRYGTSGDEVLALQAALEKEGLSVGNEKGEAGAESHFWTRTAQAVIAFQEKYAGEILTPWGFDYGTGYVAATTRAKLNAIYGCNAVGEEGKEEKEKKEEVPVETEPIQENPPIEEEEEAGSGGSSCYDSDNGKDYYVKGYATTDGGANKEWDSCRYYYSADATLDILTEVYCESNTVKTTEEQCLQGCFQGACVEDRKADFTFGDISFSSNYPLTTETVSVSSVLKNAGNMKSSEGFSINCLITKKSDGSIFYSENYTNQAGLEAGAARSIACKPNKVFTEAGEYAVTLTADSGAIVSEANEDNNKITATFAVAKKLTCYDSDGGKEIYKKGYVTYGDSNNKWEDSCSYDKYSKKYTLSETYCQTVSTTSVTTYNCDYGCQNGACVEKGLVASWKFDEGSGKSVNDSSGNNNNGMGYNLVWTEGVKGTALEFSGNSYVTVPDSSSLDLNYKGTIEAWVKYAETGYGGAIISKCKNISNYGGCNYVMSLNNPSSQFVNFQIGRGDAGFADGIVLSSGGIERDTWYYVAVTFDGNYLKAYVDGALKYSTLQADVNPAGTNDFDLLLGAMTCTSFANCYNFQGAIDEVRIYNYPLTASEIESHYSKEVPTEETPAEEVPTEETPAEEVPIEETPAVEAGRLAFQTALSSPASAGVMIGGYNVIFTEIEFTASNEDVNIKKIRIKRDGGADSYLNRIKLYDGVTKIGEAYLGTEIAGYTVFNFAPGSYLTVAKLSPKTISVRADIGTYAAVNSGTEITLGIDSASDVEAIGASSGTTINPVLGDSAKGNKMYLFRTLPTVSLNNSSPSGQISPGAETEVFRFDASAADSGFDLTLRSIKFSLASNVNNVIGGKTFKLYKSANLTSPLATGVAVADGSGAGYVSISFPSKSIIETGSTATYLLKGDTALLNQNATGTDTLTVSVYEGNFYWDDGSGVTTNKGVFGLPIYGNTLLASAGESGQTNEIADQLASMSEAVSKLMKRIKEILGK